MDYGGGKFDNLKEYLKKQYDINLYIYDKYNRSPQENEKALSQTYNLIVCNNVLNTIMEDEIIHEVIHNINSALNEYGMACFYIYECDKSGVGKETKKDCWQRNEVTEAYIRFLQDFKNVSIKGKIIWCMHEKND